MVEDAQITTLEGETLDGKYRVVKLLGRGGMGSVYEATHTGTGRRVAVKVINAHDIGRNKMMVTRFQREAKAAGSVDTEHIVQVLDTGVDPTTSSPFMVMEYLSGEDLDMVLKRIDKLRTDTALRIFAQACIGIQKAHEAGVVHRDIKPANLFLAQRDAGELVVKILDFGIAKVKLDQQMALDATGLTRTGSMLGSPLYMSPEQARGIKDIDHRTDLWSLGVVLYRMLAGVTPHDEIEALGDLIIAICSEGPRPIQGLAPWVPRDVAAIVHRALKLDPAERFQTAAEMLEAVKPLLDKGRSLEQSMLVTPTAAEKAVLADALTISQPGSRSVVRVSTGDVTGPTLDVATQSAVTSSAFGRPPRTGSKIGIAVAAVLGASIGAFGLYKAMKSEPTGADVQPTATAVAHANPPASVPTIEPGPPVQATKSVKLVVMPSDVTVEIDGADAATKGGIVEITGTLGSIHKIKLKRGKDETTGEVIVTEAGASPPKLELNVPSGVAGKGTAKPGPVVVPPGGGPLKPPGPATGTPVAPPPSPGIKEKFE